jgi:hypothetical protein
MSDQQEEWLDKLDWADEDDLRQQWAEMIAVVGPALRERAEEVGREAALAEFLRGCGLL